MTKALTGVVRLSAMLAIGWALAGSVSCSTGDGMSPTATSTAPPPGGAGTTTAAVATFQATRGASPAATTPLQVATAPPGWQSFDQGALSGAARPGWELYVLTAEEFLRLSKGGLSHSILNASGSKLVGELKPSDVPGVVLVILAGPDGFPNLNVQPCYKGAAPVSLADGKDFAQAYAKGSGLNVEVSGEAAVDGGRFALFKVGFFKEIDTYQAFAGSRDCASIATLTTRPGDAAAVGDFKTFLSVLKVAH